MIRKIQHLLAQELPFVCYRLPGDTKICCYAGGSFQSGSQHSSGHFQFVIAPFQDESDKVLYYSPEWLSEDLVASASIPVLKKGQKEMQHGGKPSPTSFEDYLKQAETLIRLMKSTELRKVVLSRVLEAEIPESRSVAHLFDRACRLYPMAFVYLFSLNGSSNWIGASPETLLDVHHSSGHTMALAGTQKLANVKPEKMTWLKKEVVEHEYVSDFIREKLQRFGVDNLQQSPGKTVSAGKVAHLQTNFDFSLKPNQRPLDLAFQLHPTPAVCGVPTSVAFPTILQTEKHSRDFYTGFLGPVNGLKDASLFVNLRCMQVIENIAYIFVGGGLTEASDPLVEWNETEWKAETMLALFQ